MFRTVFGLIMILATVRSANAKLNNEEMAEVLSTIDARLHVPSDYTARVYLEERESSASVRVLEVLVLRRDRDRKLILLFTKPKTEAGKGYLRSDANLWHYNPRIGKWTRQTDRDRIGDTGSRRRDFDDWNLSAEYDPEYVATEKVGQLDAHRLKLRVKPGVTVAFPTLEIWVDVATRNLLRMDSLAQSGKVLIVNYYPKWGRARTPAGKEIFFPKEIRVFDKLKKGSSTVIKIEKVMFEHLPDNVFTKAWLESKSR